MRTRHIRIYQNFSLFLKFEPRIKFLQVVHKQFGAFLGMFCIIFFSFPMIVLIFFYFFTNKFDRNALHFMALQHRKNRNSKTLQHFTIYNRAFLFLICTLISIKNSNSNDKVATVTVNLEKGCKTKLSFRYFILWSIDYLVFMIFVSFRYFVIVHFRYFEQNYFVIPFRFFPLYP